MTAKIDQPNPFFPLPYELTVNIFSFLPIQSLCKAARVCSLFAMTAGDDSLWKEQVKLAKMPEGLLVSLLPKRQLFVRELAERTFHVYLDQEEVVSDASVQTALSALPRVLESIEIRADGTAKSNLSRVAFEQIVNCCPNLQAFGLVTSDLEQFLNITDDDIDQLTRSKPALKSVTLQGCSQITEQGLMSLSANCDELHEVDVESNSLTDAFVIALVQKHKKLQKLALSGTTTALSDNALVAIAKNCPTLRSLQLRVTLSSFSQQATHGLIKALGTLESFSFKGCTEVSDPMIHSLSNSLAYLHINGCRSVTELAIVDLANRCQKLSLLAMNDCPNPEALNATLENLKPGKFAQLERHQFLSQATLL